MNDKAKDSALSVDFALSRDRSDIDDQHIWCQFDPGTDGEQFGAIYIWSELLKIAAEELAKAFGAHLGAELAQRFVDALLGNGDGNQFEDEVRSRLSGIEEKLAELIRYLIK